MQRVALGNDEVVVPMHGAEKEIDFNTVDESQYPNPGGLKPLEKQKTGETQNTKLSSLPISQRTCAEKLLPFIGEEIPCMMYSSKW